MAINYIVLKRLHSIVGIIPVGAFLIFHLNANAYAFSGREVYDAHVKTLYEIPYLIFLEIFFIWIPILFHALLGLYIIWRAQYNTLQYPYSGNWFYFLQRITGIIAFIFIIYHVATTRFKFNLREVSAFDSMRGELFEGQSFRWTYFLYPIGIVSSCFHFANGIWSFLINFGVLQGEKSQRAARYVCLCFGLILVGLGLISLRGFYKGV